MLTQANGEILEIGFGTGLNLQHYPTHVRQVTAVDPGEGRVRLARRRMERCIKHREVSAVRWRVRSN
jgi:hypothetical protein